jgi:hypothetical protein
MAEILARHERLASEYTHILKSYLHEDGNYLEHEGLQRGVLWAIGRMGRARPDLVHDASSYLLPFMNSPDPVLRGLAAWAAISIPSPVLEKTLEKLSGDPAVVKVYSRGRFSRFTVGQLATLALA